MSAIMDKVVVAAALLLLGISLLNPGGMITGVLLAGALLLAWFGGRYWLRLEESRRMGEKAGHREGFRERLSGSGSSDDSQRWER